MILVLDRGHFKFGVFMIDFYDVESSDKQTNILATCRGNAVVSQHTCIEKFHCGQSHLRKVLVLKNMLPSLPQLALDPNTEILCLEVFLVH